ncbi:bifunctional diguanylate cyclase/phosphodiesterase [Kineococcus sp. SYSU DK002]|uniref:bifunctional diguanylate cyclase/phosphodiesterase n=1 Tax=Kineococcus sp. SYSU DK002 TaxID=3383123 RepID=UPI003D7D5988
MSPLTSPHRPGERSGSPLEVQRLAVLHSYDVLDVPADVELDDVVHTAAMLSGVPNATLNLIDADRQCQLTTVGFEGTDSARSDSMCALHFLDGEVVHVRDASRDERFATNPWVDGRMARVRLYASAPLLTPEGHALGSLCVFDTEPGELTAEQLSGLERLARVVVALFERRRQSRIARTYAGEAHRSVERAEQLAARNAELRLVLDATSDAFLAVDADQRITSWNAAAERMFGWTVEEALGRTLAETILPASAAAAHHAGFARFLRTGTARLTGSVEVPARHRDGTGLAVELTLTPVEVGGQRRFYAAMRDVTDRRRMEQELRSLAGIVAGARDAIISVDGTGAITSWNAAAEQLYGYRAEEVLGAGLGRVASTAEVQQLRAWLIRATSGAGAAPVDARDTVGRHRDGTDVEVSVTVSPVLDAAGAVVGASIAARDTAERRRAEAALREAEQRFSLAFTHAPTGVLITALTGEAEGRFLHTNPAVCRMLGYSREELLGKTFADVTHPEDLHVSREQVRRLVEGGTPSAHLEKRYVRADGTVIWVALDMAVIHDGDGRPRYAVTHVEDVTAKRADRQRLAASEQRFRLAFDTAPVGMVIVGLGDDDAARVLQVNSTLCRFTGLSAEDLLTRDVHDLIDPEDRAGSSLALAPLLLGERPRDELELRFRHADGTVRWGLLSATAMTDPAPDGTSRRHLLCLVEDVTARKAAEQALRHQALHDGLTGLPNRTLLHDRLEHALAAAGRSGTGVGVLFCDLDGFKAVNDSAGHGAGDDLLRTVAARFGACLRPGDTLARLGGDEFAVVCPDVTSTADLQVIAERLLGALHEPVSVAAGTFVVGVSVGTHLVTADDAARGGDGRDPRARAEQALARADGAMYEAKRAGKNRVHAGGAGEGEARSARAARLLPELRTALDRDELVLHGQPVLDLATGRPVAVETLVRWQHPQRGVLSPAEFLDVAEDSPLVLELGRRVLEESCRMAAAWSEALGPAAPAVHVNVSGRQLESASLTEDVLGALRRHGLPAHRLVLELTETTMPRITHSLLGDLQRLRDLGVRIALDDLGTGYSSLARLTELPVDLLKVDLTFVAGLGRDPSCDAVVRAVLGIGQALGLSVVAEGVETPQQADLLRRYGCDTVQGYLYSPPRPESVLVEVLCAGLSGEAAGDRGAPAGAAGR